MTSKNKKASRRLTLAEIRLIGRGGMPKGRHSSLEQAADAIADTIGVLHHAAMELDHLRSTDRSTHPGDSCVEAVVGAIKKLHRAEMLVRDLLEARKETTELRAAF